MNLSATNNLEGRLDTYYEEGRCRHGDLGLSYSRYLGELKRIGRRYLGQESGCHRIYEFVGALHCVDLYLTISCGQKLGRAWERFAELYGPYLERIALLFCRRPEAAAELAADVMTDLFLPDRSGCCRIASYHGRSAVRTWLRTLVSNRAINRRQLISSKMETIETLPDLAADDEEPRRFESALRHNRYQCVISESIREACQHLDDRERLLLLLRYEQCLRLHQIGNIVQVQPSTVCRNLKSVQIKLRREIISSLSARYLSSAEIDECLAELREMTSAYCVLPYLRAS